MFPLLFIMLVGKYFVVLFSKINQEQILVGALLFIILVEQYFLVFVTLLKQPTNQQSSQPTNQPTHHRQPETPPPCILRRKPRKGKLFQGPFIWRHMFEHFTGWTSWSCSIHEPVSRILILTFVSLFAVGTLSWGMGLKGK